MSDIPQYYTKEETEQIKRVYSHLLSKTHNGQPLLKIKPHSEDEDKFYVTIFDEDKNREMMLKQYKEKYNMPFDFNTIHQTRTE